jgi:uncharacterized delta-60 repeat protein
MIKSLCFCFLFAALTPCNCISQAGTIDKTFGSGGFAVTSHNGVVNGKIMRVTRDNKIILAGSIQQDYTSDFFLARYLENGLLDPDFGNGGVAPKTFGTGLVYAKGMALQSDGKIVVGGQMKHENYSEVVLARYTTNGQVDQTFGEGGIARTRIGENTFIGATALVVQSDDKIIVTSEGESNIGSGEDFIVLRYHTHGVLDETFGVAGVTAGAFLASGAIYPTCIAMAADGGILVGGIANTAINHEANALVKFSSNGTVDMGFAHNGFDTLHLTSGSSRCNAMAVTASGEILVAGQSSLDRWHFSLCRYLPDGRRDLSFGSNGRFLNGIDVPPGYQPSGLTNFHAMCNSITLKSEGIYLGGAVSINGESSFALMRVTYNGKADPGFGYDGLVTAKVPGELNAYSHCIGLQSGARIILGGNSDAHPILMRFNGGTDPLTVDETFEIFPNPAGQQLMVHLPEFDEETSLTLELVNTQGTTIYSLSLKEKSAVIDLPPITSGLYSMRLRAGDNVTTRKLVIDQP